jgi:hypothetical protein
MKGLDELGMTETAGVHVEAFAVWPPEIRFHQEGVLDTIIAAYREPETSEIIPIGRVVSSPYTQVLDHDDEEYTAETLSVKGLVGDSTIYDRYNTALYVQYGTVGLRDSDKMTESLKDMQARAGKMVLTCLGLKRPNPLRRLGAVIIRKKHTQDNEINMPI